MRRSQITIMGEVLKRDGGGWLTSDGFYAEQYEGDYGYSSGACSWRFYGGPRNLGETFASSLRNAVEQIQDHYRRPKVTP